MKLRTLRSSPLPTSAIPPVCMLGLYLVLLGAALLISPHWFSAAIYAPWHGFEIPVGLVFLASGATLLWVAILPVHWTWMQIGAYLLVALCFGGMAVLFGRTGAVHGALVYGALTSGALLLGCLQFGLLSPALLRVFARRPLATLVHLIALLTGVLMLQKPGQYAGPLYVAMQPSLPLFGALFVLLGGVLFIRDIFGPEIMPKTAAFVELVLIGVLLWWGSGFVTVRAWTGAMTYAFLTLGLVNRLLLDHWRVWRGLTGSFGDPLRRLVALTVASGLVAAAVMITVALTATSADSARDESEANAKVLAGAVSEQLNFYLQTHLAVVGQVAELPAVKGGTLAQTRAVLQETQTAFPGFFNLSLVDPAGRQVVRSTDGAFVDLGSKPYIQRALSGEERVFGGVTISLLTGDPIVVMASPVRDAETAHIIGAISASIQFPTISNFLTDLRSIQDQEVIVLDETGLVVAHSTPAFLEPDTFTGTRALTIIQGESSGSAQYVLNGQRFLAGYSPVSTYNWDVIVQQPESLALAGAWRLEERAFLVFVFASVLLTGLGLGLVDRLFRPVVALIEPLRALGEGRYEVALPDAAEGEMGNLVRAFERMRRDLRDREVALGASEARFRSLIENGSDIVIVTDVDGLARMVTSSIEPTLGYAVENFIGVQYLGNVHPEDQAKAREEFDSIRSRPNSERMSELRFRHHDGSWRTFETVTMNRVDDASVEGIVISLRDITERRRLQKERDRLYADLMTEFRRAAEIQAMLLPHAAPDLPGYEFAGVCLPARQVGGDFFDWHGDARSVRLSLGDAMGKGMPASLLTATVRAALRAVADLPVSAAVDAVNRALLPDLAQSDGFITLFHAALDPVSGVLTYVDAGHGMVFVQRKDGRVDPLRQRALPLGVLLDAAYPAGSTTLEPGDTLVIYSDGLPDARPDLDLGSAGVARLLGVGYAVQAGLDGLVKLVADVDTRPDDLTVVLVRRQIAVRLETAGFVMQGSFSQ